MAGTIDSTAFFFLMKTYYGFSQTARSRDLHTFKILFLLKYGNDVWAKIKNTIKKAFFKNLF